MSDPSPYQLTTLTDSGGRVIPHLVDPNGDTATKGSTCQAKHEYSAGETVTLEIDVQGDLVVVNSVTSGPTAWRADSQENTWSTTVTIDGQLLSETVGFTMSVAVKSSDQPPQGMTTDDGWVCQGPSTSQGDDWYDWTLDPYIKLKRKKMLSPTPPKEEG